MATIIITCPTFASRLNLTLPTFVAEWPAQAMAISNERTSRMADKQFGLRSGIAAHRWES